MSIRSRSLPRKKIVQENKTLTDAIELRLQSSPQNILKDLIRDDEKFDVSICNPPFHASRAEAQAGSIRKWNNLKNSRSNSKPKLNFGGRDVELWCPGGEAEFVRRMIEQSSAYAQNVLFFSSLISKEENLPAVLSVLKKTEVTEGLTLEMTQGQKRSRAVVWTFMTDRQQQEWRTKRWRSG